MSLVARYRLNGSVADATGKTTILSQAGSPTYGIGKLGTCMNFDGIDDTIETSLNPSLVLDPKVFSISVWCKITDTSNYRGLFGCHLDTGPGGTTTGLALQFDSGYFYCILGSGVGSKWYNLRIPAANVPLNKLMNIMLIANGKTFKLFIDVVDMNCSFVDYTGSVVSFETATIKLGPRFLIGRGWDGVDRYFKGTLEDLRIYDHALSAKETKEILKAKILHLTFDDYEEPTTNYNPYSYITGVGPGFRPTFLPGLGYKGTNAVKIEKLSTDGVGDWQYAFTTIPAYVAGDSFTLSLKYKSSGGFFNLGDWAGGNGNQPGWTTDEDYEIGDGWRFRSATIKYNDVEVYT